MNLVFTSAGDNTNFDELWLAPERNYKVWVVYYGDNNEIYEKYKSKVDYIERRKGSKFQNFYHIWKTKDLSKFDRFFILDDDILINTRQINQMFWFSSNCNLSVCGPSFDKKSKISWSVTRNQPETLLRFTNFVEVNVPLFDRKTIEKLMEVYDESLIGWGIDFLYSWLVGPEKRNSIAIIDAVICTNPKDSRKGGKRELTNIKNWDKRANYWKTYRDKNRIEEVKPSTWWTIRNTATGKSIIEKLNRDLSPRKQWLSGKLNFKKTQKPKIAFLFLTVGDLAKPKEWYKFLKDGEDKCNIYCHSKFKDKIGTSFIRDNQIEKHFDSFWGGPGLVLATIALLSEAVKDASNKYFVLICDSSIPLYDFKYTYDKLINFKKSMVNFTNSPVKGYHNYINAQIEKDSPIKYMSKCSQWMGLNREHALLVARKGYETFDKSMKNIPIPDEWYFRSLLQQFDPDFKNTNERKIKIMARTFKIQKGFSAPMVYNSVNLKDFPKENGMHPLFLRKITPSTKINT